jgi:hypothetical protein
MKRLMFGFLIIFSIGCTQPNKPFLQRINECVSDKIIDKDSLLPFDKSFFKKSVILSQFIKRVTVDSSVVKTHNGDSLLSYIFQDDSSKIVFCLSNLSQGKHDFDIIDFDLKSNLFRFKNGIKINMTRTDFYNKILTKETNCDSFDIKFSRIGNFLRFIFVRDTLKHIKTEYIEL